MVGIDPILGERIARNGLGPHRCDSVAGAAGLVTAVQAQDNQASRLGIRARTTGVTEADVVSAIGEQRSVVRTWLMRGTIHLVDAADLRWLVALIGPAVTRKYRTRWRAIGLADDLLDRTLDVLPQILHGAALTRHELRAALHEHGIDVDTGDPQASTHAVLHACCAGLVCRGPDRGRDSTFVLTDDWVPAADGPRGDAALAELARRYFRAFAPATAADFATWSGLPGATAVGLVRDELTEVDVYGRAGYRLRSADGLHAAVAAAGEVRLLPAFDNYLLGYRDRDAIVREPDYGRIFLGGMIRPSVLVGGRVAGHWALERARRRVGVTLFEPLGRATRRAVEREVADVARFVGLDLEPAFVEPG